MINPSEIKNTVLVKQNDTARILYDTLTVSDETNTYAVDLTNCTASLLWYDYINELMTAKSASIETPAVSGSVSYLLTSDDVSTVNDYLLQWKVTYSDGKVLTLPESKYIKLNITPTNE